MMHACMSEVEREAGLQSRRAHDANASASMSEVEREAQNLARSQCTGCTILAS